MRAPAPVPGDLREPWARRTFASLRTPAYRRFFTGHVLSLLGFWMRVIVQGWLVYDLTGSKALLGVVTAVGLLPFVLLSPYGGVLADRVERRRLLMAAQTVAVVVNLALGLLVLADAITFAAVLVAAGVVGAARAIEIPVRNAFVSDLVGREDLGNAIALNAAGFNVARVVGPAIGGGLLVLIGMGPCFLLVAVLGTTMLWALAGLDLARRAASAEPTSVWRQVLEGLRHVHGHRRTRTLLLLLAISLICTWAYQTLMPAFARDVLGLGESGYGLLMATAGVGALLGALWVAGRAGTLPARRGVVFGLVWCGALSVFTLAFVRSLAFVLPVLAVAGFCQVGFMATANTMVQESAPELIRGRVMGIYTFVFGAAFPVGSLLMGGVSEALGVQSAWAGGAVLTLVLSALVRWRLPRREPIASVSGPAA